jgi:hypothetical protein
MEEWLKNIEKSFGVAVAFEVNFQDVYAQIQDASYRDRLGEIIYDSYLKEIAGL